MLHCGKVKKKVKFNTGREGFRSKDQRKVTCALSPAQSFRNTHSNTHSKGERRTHHRKIHRRTLAGTHTPGQGAE
jgi:hypothetical protein